MVKAIFTKTSDTTSSLLFHNPLGNVTVVPGIVSCPRLLVDQRGIELDLIAKSEGVELSDIDVQGIENKYERDWVIYQAKNWRGHLNRCLQSS